MRCLILACRVKSKHEDTLRSTHAICSGLNAELGESMYMIVLYTCTYIKYHIACMYPLYYIACVYPSFELLISPPVVYYISHLAPSEKAMRDSKEAQALLQSQLAALEAERQEVCIYILDTVLSMHTQRVNFSYAFDLRLTTACVLQALRTAEEEKEKEAASTSQVQQLKK